MLTLYNPSNPRIGTFATLNEKDQTFVQDSTLRVCGMAFTNDNEAARVNAFGPLSFCETFHYGDKSVRH